jgi:CheY-like chemotaxis protein
VLVSDLGMPGEDGYALVRRGRALPRDRGGRVPAVALTACVKVSWEELAPAVAPPTGPSRPAAS